MFEDKGKILIYGYGNPGRQDDGLGNHMVDVMRQWAEENNNYILDFDSNYQLNIEDADRIKDKEVVIFVDASVEDITDYCITKVYPDSNSIEFTMHACSPSFVSKLCGDIFKKTPFIYLLHLKGYEYELKEGITEKALNNLNNAFSLMKILLEGNNLTKIISRLENACLNFSCYY